MKRVLFSICALALIVTSLGCATCNCNRCRAQRQACGPGLVGRLHGDPCGNGLCGRLHGNGGGLCNRGAYGGGGNGYYGDPGPATATVAYPYYTLRGPRDFLAKNPRGIGP